MSVLTTVSKVYKQAKRMDFDDRSKIILMSDCHRSDGSGADNSIHNQNIVSVALRHYYDENFIYIELGDGDELWENKEFGIIAAVSGKIFDMLKKFQEKNRLFFIYGNHDMIKGDQSWVQKNMAKCGCDYGANCKPLFPGIEIYEGIVLSHRLSKDEIFLLHGHQADFLNYNLWRLTRFLVRYFWRAMQLIGIKDPLSPANNQSKKSTVEKHLSKWADKEHKMIIAGHTHRAEFPDSGESLYFNDGCCVYPYYITAIEIENGGISLVKWGITADKNGLMRVGREIMRGPKNIREYF